ncbi:MAG TPA: DNA-3-methyladenine glycosylase [Candidatus Binataceae bacterium]|nr:DNA-3-methyladenine glycosylase [Candidatus Binataceae bacterium]
MASATVPYARAARAHLVRIDPVLARIISQVGPIRLARRSERFQALARAIVFQQLAGSAAMAIYNRLVALFPGTSFPSPEQVLATPDDALRKVGLSAKKVLYLKDLALHIQKDSLNFHRFPRMTDEEIIGDLTRVKGIGRWTAEMFLMFTLARPDVFPATDLGLQNAVTKAYGMRKRPTPKRMREIGERWQPYRTAAAWYLWQSLRITLPDSALAPPTKRPATRRTRRK